jgi:hypothetical protein
VTSRSYRDLSADSPTGAYRFEAVSAENGAINGRDGQPMKNEFRMMQRNFRYRLCEVDGTVIWERWQDEEEASPVRLWVSDSGAAVARAHFASWHSDDLLFFDNDGELKLTVRVASAGYEPEFDGDQEEVASGELEYWVDEKVGATSAGPIWTPGSMAFFVDQDERFIVHTRWGRRIIVCRREWKVVRTDVVDSEIEQAERAASALILNQFLRRGEFPSDYDEFQDLQGALVLAWRHNLVEARAALVRLERVWKTSGGYCSSKVLPDGWYVRQDSLLKIGNCLSWKVRDCALSVDACLFGRPNCGATKEDSGEEDDDEPESEEELEWEAHPTGIRGNSDSLAEVPRRTTPGELARTHGYPDDVRSLFDKQRRKWSESWDYDFADRTIRIVWEYPEAELDGSSGIASVQRIHPPLWTSWERVLSAWR